MRTVSVSALKRHESLVHSSMKFGSYRSFSGSDAKPTKFCLPMRHLRRILLVGSVPASSDGTLWSPEGIASILDFRGGTVSFGDNRVKTVFRHESNVADTW